MSWSYHKENRLDNLTPTSLIEGKTDIGKQWTTYLTRSALIRTTRDKKLWRSIIAYILKGHDICNKISLNRGLGKLKKNSLFSCQLLPVALDENVTISFASTLSRILFIQLHFDNVYYSAKLNGNREIKYRWRQCFSI